MMKYLMYLCVLLVFVSCKSSNEAVYKKDPEHHLINENQLLQEIKKNPSDLQTLLNGINSKIKSNFSWNDFWSLSLKKSIFNGLNLENFNEIMNLSTKTCSQKSFSSIQNLTFDYDFLKNKNEEEIERYYRLQLSFYQRCYNSKSNFSKESVKRVNSHVKKIKSNLFTRALMSIIKTDAIINKKVTISSNRFNTFNVRQFMIYIKKNSEGTNLENFVELLRLHKEMSPFSSKDRAELIVHFLGDDRKRKKVVEVATIQEINSAIEEISKEEEVKVPQNTFSFLFNSVINKIKSKYKTTTRYDDIEQIISLLWRDYSKLYENLNLSEGLIKNKKELLLIFNQANKVFEDIIKMPINRSIAIDYLESIKLSNELLAVSHIVKLKSRELYRFDLRDAVATYDTVNKTTSLEKLLLHRLRIYSLADRAVENFCSLMVNEFKIDKTEILENEVKNYLNKESVGCFKVKFKNELKSLKANQTSKSAQYHKVIIDKKIIDTNNDLLFIMTDTDLEIKANYYNGPFWVTTSKRELPVIKHKIPELNAIVSPIAFKVKILNNDKKYFIKDNLFFIFNYGFKKSKDVPLIKEIIDVSKLKQGFRGGDVKLSLADKSSFFPFVYNLGGKGQPGPKDIKGGLGFDTGTVEEKAFDLDDELVDYIFQNNTHLDLTYPKIEDIYKLKNYNISFHIDEWATKRIHENLCGKKLNLLLRVCYVEGKSFVIRPEMNLNDPQRIFKELRLAFSHLVSILHRPKESDLLLKREFTFPPTQKDKTSVLIFPNGKQGETGKVVIKMVR